MPETPDIMDIRLGEAIRARRRALGISQGAMAEAIGVSFQQVQKYERGANRVSFSALVKIAGALRCKTADLVAAADGEAAERGAFDRYPLQSARLVALFQQIRSPEIRDAVLRLAEAIAAKPSGGDRD